MAKKQVFTELEGQRLKLSNLDKTIYPTVGLTKAEVIEYYLEMAPFILPHAAGRPLTLIRFPDGVDGKNFYGKNKPSWTPDWMPATILPWDAGNEYLLVRSTPHLVWLANLAALELHIMNSIIESIERPDHFVIDLDPDEGYDFENVKLLAFELKVFLEGHGYVPFAKLSGGKGIHIIVPIKLGPDYDTLIAAVKALMKEFMKTHPNTTLFVHKEKRKDKVLLDIYRNHPGNTTVMAYSLRGKPGAPVSMPLPWEKITKTKSAQDFNLNTAKAYVMANGDAWANITNSAVELHTLRHKESKFNNLDPKVVEQSKEHQLTSYNEKRNFSITTEPGNLKKDHSINGKYVIQMHDATNLHFDLRLGVDGVLKSWAVPKGLPIEAGIKRLAIQTEDHPAKYFDFEGHIPDGQYGAGDMWIFDQGEIEWIKKSNDSLRFKLIGSFLKGIFTMYRTKHQDQWIIERIGNPSKRFDTIKIEPMLAESTTSILLADKHLFEIKWDGIRALVYKNGDKLKIISRNGNDLSNKFPEFLETGFIRVEQAILDVELVCLDEQGRPVFADIISRMHNLGKAKIKTAVKSKPAYVYAFDCLYINGRSALKEPFDKRQAWLKSIFKIGDRERLSEVLEDGEALFEATEKMGLEGIMAKLKNAPYAPGKRTSAWKKIKHRKRITLSVIGFTQGKGDRANVFGALHLAEREGNGWKYYGKVGTGLDMKKLKEIQLLLSDMPKIAKPIHNQIEEANRTTWIEPHYNCEVTYASLSSNETLREPVFVRLLKNKKSL